MPQPFTSAIYCINPDCPRPFPQTWGNKFCNHCGSPLQLKDRYVPLQKLGAGGFANIYTVWDLATKTERVLKVLVEPAAKAQELFEQEAAVLAQLRHPGVPRVELDGYFHLSIGNPPQRLLPCLVMEKINGKTLEALLESHPQGCPEASVLDWFAQAVEILRELHKRRIIHRDLKPSNLMLRQATNQIVMIDFGGAKKMRAARFWSQASSTRLYSPGYSPPEQSQGRDVEPTADFYALGRTMIHLLTGKPPPELEDSQTGELQWRNLVAVNPMFADLLDDLVRKDVHQRPQTAAKIQQRLQQITPGYKRRVANSRQVGQLAQTGWQQSRRLTSALTTGLSQITSIVLKAAMQLGRASWDTLKAMVLSAIAAGIATVIGFVLTYWSPLGAVVASLVARQLPDLIRHSQAATGAEILIFAAAGAGTAWGLTVAKSFGQRRRFLVAPLMAGLGYGLSWILGLVVTPYEVIAGTIGAIAISVTFAISSLGLKGSQSIHILVAVVGTTTIYVSLLALQLFPVAIFQLPTQPSWWNFWAYIGFFELLSLSLSFWLGISYYLIAPCCSWLGWRFRGKSS